MTWTVSCSACGRVSSNLLDYSCQSCGRPLVVHTELGFDSHKIHLKKFGIWRYEDFFPYVTGEPVTLGEGWTPLVKFSENVYLKLENLNPTGSFKDRGSTILVSALHHNIKAEGGFISEDSSGNAGASIAAYAASAGLRAVIYVPQNISGPKLDQIQSYGAKVVKVAGSRSKVADEAKKNRFYVGHILHPLFRDGMRSLSYELAEQLDWEIPERIYLPVSAGTLLLGLIKGFRHMEDSNAIGSTPKVVACQTRQVSPLYHRLRGRSYAAPLTVTSIADALVSVNPPLLDLMINNLKEVDGDAAMVEEGEILEAFKMLARRGYLVEPSSAVAYAAYMNQLKNGEASKDEDAIVILTGTGLKSAPKPPSF